MILVERMKIDGKTRMKKRRKNKTKKERQKECENWKDDDINSSKLFANIKEWSKEKGFIKARNVK